MTISPILTISTGINRMDTRWKHESLDIQALFCRLSSPVRSSETADEYSVMPDDERLNLKDVGGFVGGLLEGGVRNKSALQNRSIVTLDLDHIPSGQTDKVLEQLESLGCSYCVHSSRSHRPDAPRLRIILPLDRPAGTDEYEPLARKLAEHIGLDWMDASTFQAERLMFWPSVSADSEFVYRANATAPVISVDVVLAMGYTDWKDSTQWPRVPGERKEKPHQKFTAPEVIPQGERNNTLYKAACSFRSAGLSEEELLPTIQKINETRCFPPLDDEEIELIVSSACIHAPGSSTGTTIFTSNRSTAAMDFAGVGFSAEELNTGDYTDAGNSSVFVKAYRSKVLYSDALGWLIWNGQKWDANKHQALSLAVQLSDQMLTYAVVKYREAGRAAIEANLSDDSSNVEAIGKQQKEAEAFLKHAKNTRSERALNAMLNLSKGDLHVPARDLDADPFALNTPAGIVDLRTGGISSHSSFSKCTKITSSAPGSDGAEVWHSFIQQVTGGNSELSAYLQRVIGSSLFGKVFDEKLFIVYGSGRNGKSTLFNAVSSALGDYAGSISAEIFTTASRNQNAKNAFAAIRGKRMIQCSELEEGARLSVATVKALCSTDEVVVEQKYRDQETVSPSWDIFMHSNFLPCVGSRDMGTWRRIVIVPFTTTISPSEQIMNYGAHLAENCGPAIMAWAIEGARSYYAQGCKLNMPLRVQEATDGYKAAEDWINNFLTECCKEDKNGRIQASHLYNIYSTWADKNGEYRRRSNDFSMALQSRGFERRREKSGAFYFGLTFK